KNRMARTLSRGDRSHSQQTLKLNGDISLHPLCGLTDSMLYQELSCIQLSASSDNRLTPLINFLISKHRVNQRQSSDRLRPHLALNDALKSSHRCFMDLSRNPLRRSALESAILSLRATSSELLLIPLFYGLIKLRHLLSVNLTCTPSTGSDLLRAHYPLSAGLKLRHLRISKVYDLPLSHHQILDMKGRALQRSALRTSYQPYPFGKTFVKDRVREFLQDYSRDPRIIISL